VCANVKKTFRKRFPFKLTVQVCKSPLLNIKNNKTRKNYKENMLKNNILSKIGGANKNNTLKRIFQKGQKKRSENSI